MRSIDLLARDRVGDLQQLEPVGANACHAPWVMILHFSPLVSRRRRRRPQLVPCALLGASQRLANELVGQHQLGLGDEPDRKADDLAARLVELDLDADLAVLDALEHAAEALAALDRLRQLDLGLVARPSPRNRRPHQRPVDAGRGHLEAVGAGSGRATSSTGEMRCEIASQSSTVIVPSGRSAMICTVMPVAARDLTRTRRKPSPSTGSTIAASSAASRSRE